MLNKSTRVTTVLLYSYFRNKSFKVRILTYIMSVTKMSILKSARKILKGRKKNVNLILLGILLILSGATFESVESLVVLGNVGQLLTLLGLLSFLYGFSLYGIEAFDEQRKKPKT